MSASRMRELMIVLNETHNRFRDEWRFGPGSKIANKRTNLDQSRETFWKAYDTLFSEELNPLREAFIADPISSTDAVIAFLIIDVPAFRCGYEKEWYLGKLKSVPLTATQLSILKKAALDLLRTGEFRREFRDWCRLMVKIADEEFITELETLSNSTNHLVQQAAARMLNTIITNRANSLNRDSSKA